MKKALVVTALAAAAALVPALPAAAANCVYWGGTGLHVHLTDDHVVYVPLYQVDPHCLDHPVPPAP